MNSPRLLACAALATGLVALPTVVAAAAKSAPPAAHGAKKQPEWAELFGDAPLPVVWQSSVAASEKIATALTAKNLSGIPDWAETVHLATHALADQVKLGDAEQQKRLRGALAQAAQMADIVMDSAYHNDAEKAASAYSRMKSALDVAKARFPKELVDAPPQPVRFAKAPGHSHHGHGH